MLTLSESQSDFSSCQLEKSLSILRSQNPKVIFQVVNLKNHLVKIYNQIYEKIGQFYFGKF